jgi:hypothetical protein
MGLGETGPGAKPHCPHCGTEYTPSAIVTTCVRCGGELGEPPPTLNLPPAPDLSHVPAPAPPDRAAAPPAKEEEGPPPEADLDDVLKAVPPAFAPLVRKMVEEAERRSAAHAAAPPSDRQTILAPEPRRVPLSLRLAVMFGGPLSQFGWIFFGFGMIFVWAFTPAMDLSFLTVWKGPWLRAQGVVTECRPLNFSINSQTVSVHAYRYTTPDGRERQGVSRLVGQQLRPGTSAPVEYRAWDPSTSRLHESGRGFFPRFVLLFVGLFPAIGLAMLIPGLRTGWRGNRLLGAGALATGKLKSCRPTGTSVNNRSEYELIFEFPGRDGQTYTAKARTLEPERLQDQREEPVLYDALNPSYAVMLDGLPGAPAIDPSGNLQGVSPWRVLGALIVPLLVIGGHGTYLVIRFILR